MVVGSSQEVAITGQDDLLDMISFVFDCIFWGDDLIAIVFLGS